MNITISKQTFFILLACAVIAISGGMNVFLICEIWKNQQFCLHQQEIAKVMSFRNMFTEKVLLSSREIDFDTRLNLETTVRNLGDDEIFAQWQRFTKSSTKEEATLEAKTLLLLLIRKTSG